MELHQLAALIAVAEEGSVTRAAERLFTSQPALSAQIKALEQELGVELFTRLPNGMRLTDAGQQLLPMAQQMLSQSRSLKNLARQMRDGLSGTLRLGVNFQGDHFPLDQIVHSLTTQHPQLKVQCDFGASGIITKAVKGYELDSGFVEGEVRDASLHALRIGTSPLRIIAPPAWADDLPPGDFSALGRFPWVFVSEECSYHRLLERIAQEHHLVLQKQFRLGDDRSALPFVRRGMALSMIDQRNAQAAVDAGEVVYWPGFEMQVPLSLIALKSRLHEGAIAAMFEVCRAQFHVPAS